MKGTTKVIPELFAMLKSAKVEIKKSIKCWWLTRPLVSRKRAKGNKGNFKKNGKQVVTLVKKPKAGPKPETKCFYCKGNGHYKRNYPNIWQIRRMAKWTKVYLIYILLMCVGERSIFQKFLRSRKIYLGDDSNERGEWFPCTLVDRKRKRYDNAIDVVVRLHYPTDPSTESTTPLRSAHVHSRSI